jgi:hypothetical protein
MMGIRGKGFFIWKIKNCENGDVQQISQLAKMSGFSHVLIKVANGRWKYNYDWENHIDWCPDLVTALRRNGIEPWGWHYVFGDDPIREAKIAVERVKELDLKGYVIDAEAHYKREKHRHEAAERFMRDLRKGVGKNVPLALSSYRFPSLHPEIPWNQFLTQCDINMPQVYWIHAHNPKAQLEKTIREFSSPKFKAHPPIIPTGAAFTEHGWTVTSEEVQEFLEATRTFNLAATNFWEWYSARERIPIEVWETIRDYDWDSGLSSSQDIAVAYIQALNSQDINQIIALYTDSSVHVSSARTISGIPSLKAWYGNLIKRVLPNANFTLTGYSGTGSSRHLTWTAESQKVKVMNGSDTFGINQDGKITYHYTFFSLS